MKKLLAVLLIALLVMGIVLGCNKTPAANDNNDQPSVTADNNNGGGSDVDATPVASDEATPVYGGTFIAATASDPNTLLYAWLTSGKTNTMSCLLNDKPFLLGSDGEIKEYRVCDSYSVSDDGLVYTFHVRDGVKWHDGTPVLASDICWTVNVARSEDWFMSLQFDAPGTWEAVDESTFTVTLDEPNSTLLTYMADMHIQPEHYFDGLAHSEFYSCEQATKPIGCGPFKFIEYKVGDYLRFEAFEDFWAGRPYIDNAYIKITGGSQYTEMAFESGQVSIYQTTEDYYEEIKDDPSYQFVIGPTTNVCMVSFSDAKTYKYDDKDCQSPMYKGDRVIREAMCYMVPYDEIIDKVLRGACERSYSMVPTSNRWYTDEGMPRYTYDLDKANAILDEAGYVDTDGDGIRNWKDGSNITVAWSYYDAGGVNERMSVLMAENCNKCGIAAILSTEEQTSWMESLLAEKPDFNPDDVTTECSIYYYGSYGSEPFDYWNSYSSWGGQSEFKNWNTGEYYSAEDIERMYDGPEMNEFRAKSDELFKKMESEPDKAEEYFHEIQRMWTADWICCAPIGTMEKRIAMQGNIRGADEAIFNTASNYGLFMCMERIWIDPNA